MDYDDEGMSLVDAGFWFFERYNLADIIFLYLILQIVFLFSTFKFSESFNLDLDAKDRSWKYQLLIKPMTVVVFICLFLLFSAFYVSIFAFCYWGAIQLIPEIWELLFSKKINVPEFNFSLVIKDGVILFMISYLLGYSANRNLEINDLRK